MTNFVLDMFKVKSKDTTEVVTEVFAEEVLKDFAKLTGKHLCLDLFFDKVADLKPATLLKKRLTQVFPCEL